MTSDLPAFKAALAKGSGRAMILLRNAKAPGFVTALLEACWLNPTYDRQCEADRAPWLARLVGARGEVADLYERILAGVESCAESEDGMAFALRVLSHLAAAHPDLDRTRLLAILSTLDDEHRVEMAEQLIQLNGYPAFREALTWIASAWEDDCWMIDDWLRALRAREGPGIEAVLLADAATDDLLMRALTGREEVPLGLPREPVSFESLRESLKQYKVWVVSGPRSEAEREVLARDLAAIDEAEQALPYLRFFARQPLPGDPRPLLRWRNDANPRVRQFARSALENVEHWAVRALAVEALQALEPWSVGLLKANYQPGDYGRIAPLLDAELTTHQAHELCIDLLDIRDKLSAEERRDALLRMYDITPCSFCRSDVVKALADASKLPHWMAEECRFDADPDTVALVTA